MIALSDLLDYLRSPDICLFIFWFYCYFIFEAEECIARKRYALKIGDLDQYYSPDYSIFLPYSTNSIQCSTTKLHQFY